MKHPYISLSVGLAVFIIYPIAILALNYQRVINLGFQAVFGFGIIFSVIPVILWWLSSKIVLENTFYKVNKDDGSIVFNEYLKGWKNNIMIGSFSSSLCSIVFLLICYYFKLPFKVFIFLNLITPIVRIIIYFATNRTKVFKKAKDKLTDEFI